ncbi:helix-turn-helix domain-containing protein [Lysinibacillus sp. NPDC096418]|uniref:helix-turn-helix domain-containing protein n=1 Tax=Lysinibacillus sp. NPDC096418 TaxID=3364138 RepID=UPI003808B446
MIKITLDRIMFEKKIKVPQLVEKSGLNKNTLYALQKNEVTRIDLNTLDALCIALDCDITDIIEFTPNKKDSL